MITLRFTLTIFDPGRMTQHLSCRTPPLEVASSLVSRKISCDMGFSNREIVRDIIFMTWLGHDEDAGSFNNTGDNSGMNTTWENNSTSN